MQPVAIEDEGRPVAGMRERSARAEELQLGETQRLGLRLAVVQLEVELLHQLGRGLVRDPPESGDGRAGARRQESAAEALQSLAADVLSPLGIASGKRREVHSTEVEIVDLLEVKVVERRLRSLPREEDPRALRIGLVRHRVRREV